MTSGSDCDSQDEAFTSELAAKRASATPGPTAADTTASSAPADMEKMDSSSLPQLRARQTRDLLVTAPKSAVRVQQQSVFQSMWIGATAGMGGIIAVYPVDVVKTRMQNSRVASSAVQTLTTIFRNEGAGSFYKGLGPQLCGTIPDKAVSLATREFVKSFFDKPNEFKASLTSAAVSGVAQSIVMNPVEVVKVRMQLDSSLKPFGVIREVGMQGLYRGYTACLARDVFFASTYFTLYDLAKNKLGVQDGTSLGWSMVAASTAGIPAALLSTPLDLLKTRMQSRDATVHGFMNTYRQVTAEGGLGALFSGWGPRVSRIAPQFGIVLVSFDWLSHRFNPQVTVPEPADADAYADY